MPKQILQITSPNTYFSRFFLAFKVSLFLSFLLVDQQFLFHPNTTASDLYYLLIFLFGESPHDDVLQVTRALLAHL